MYNIIVKVHRSKVVSVFAVAVNDIILIDDITTTALYETPYYDGIIGSYIILNQGDVCVVVELLREFNEPYSGFKPIDRLVLPSVMVVSPHGVGWLALSW